MSPPPLFSVSKKSLRDVSEGGVWRGGVGSAWLRRASNLGGVRGAELGKCGGESFFWGGVSGPGESFFLGRGELLKVSNWCRGNLSYTVVMMIVIVMVIVIVLVVVMTTMMKKVKIKMNMVMYGSS